MSQQGGLRDAKRELDAAAAALLSCGSAERPNIECRVASLQDRFLAREATSLDDLAARLDVIRALVVTLGEPGLLLNMVDAARADVEALKHAERVPPSAPPSDPPSDPSAVDPAGGP